MPVGDLIKNKNLEHESYSFGIVLTVDAYVHGVLVGEDSMVPQGKTLYTVSYWLSNNPLVSYTDEAILNLEYHSMLDEIDGLLHCFGGHPNTVDSIKKAIQIARNKVK